MEGEEMKKYWRRFLVWVGILKLRPEKEIIDLIKRNMKIEEQAECDHKMLSALFPNDVWYRCTNCNQLWIITDAMVLKHNRIPEIIKKMEMVLKIKPKNVTTTPLKKWQKEKKK